MDPFILDQIKQRYHYQAWRNSTTLSENLFVWPASVPDDGFPGWSPLSNQMVTTTSGQAPSDTRLPLVYTTPRTMQSMWRGAMYSSNALMSVDLFQTASRRAAHELLLRLLGEFQSLLITRIPTNEIGDVCFSGPGRHLVVFARANLVLLMRNAGKDLISIEEPAYQFDRRLIERPTVRPESQSEIPELQVALLPERTTARIEVVAPQELSMVKFFSGSGEVHWLMGRLVYTSTRPGQQDLEVYGISPRGGMDRTVQPATRYVHTWSL
jgi:hypothetical protein